MDPPPGSAPSALPSPGSSGQEARDPLGMGTGINHLPDEILLEIFSRLPCNDLILTCRLVCLRWREVADSTVLWKRKFDQWKKSPPGNVSFAWQRPDDFYIFGRLKRNLIKNPCGEEGMDFWETGTSSEGQWEIQTLPEEEICCFTDRAINKCFSASKGLCVKSQRITLKDHGYWEDLMDTARPQIAVEDILCPEDDNYQLTVQLLSADNQVLQEYRTQGVKNFMGRKVWRNKSYTFKDYPSGVRHILFQHQGGGVDRSDPKRNTRVTRSRIVVSWRPSYNESFDSDDDYDQHDCYNYSDEEDKYYNHLCAYYNSGVDENDYYYCGTSNLW